MEQASEIGCFSKCEKKNENKDAEKEKTSILLGRSFLQEKTQAWEELEKKKRKENQEPHENETKRLPYPSFIFEKKPNFMEVFYVNIPGSKSTKKLLIDDLPKRWTMPAPEAIISITGIDHQFNIKDKYNLKKELIDAVISTGSWVVTCGTESRVVRFIEEAVNEHVAMNNHHIPIVGIMSQRIYDEMKERKSEDTIAIKRLSQKNWFNVPRFSTKEVLDPIHTQFIFAKDPNGNPFESAATCCREAFEQFLMNINKHTDCEAEIRNKIGITEQEPQNKYVQWKSMETLPVILVVIEGGVDALQTALSVLRNNYHVVVIDGSGGAANFLSNCYRRFTSSNLKLATLSDFEKYIKELKNDCYEDDTKDLKEKAEELINLCFDMFKNDTLFHIHVYSLEKSHIKVAEHIQDAISNTFKDYYGKEIDIASGPKTKYELNIKAVNKQLKLVEKWKRCDIAEREIFISKHRAQLTCLQTINEKRMSKLPGKLERKISDIGQMYENRLEGLTDCRNEFEQNILEIDKKNKTHNYEVFSTAHNKLIHHVDHMPVEYIKRYKKELYEIKTRYEAWKNETNELELPRMTELKELIKRKLREFTHNYAFIINNLATSYEKFEKSVLQFEEVNKEPYYLALNNSFNKLIGPMPDDICEKLKKKFEEIETELIEVPR